MRGEGGGVVFLGLEGHCLSVYEFKNVSLSSASSLLKNPSYDSQPGGIDFELTKKKNSRLLDTCLNEGT